MKWKENWEHEIFPRKQWEELRCGPTRLILRQPRRTIILHRPGTGKKKNWILFSLIIFFISCSVKVRIFYFLVVYIDLNFVWILQVLFDFDLMRFAWVLVYESNSSWIYYICLFFALFLCCSISDKKISDIKLFFLIVILLVEFKD